MFLLLARRRAPARSCLALLSVRRLHAKVRWTFAVCRSASGWLRVGPVLPRRTDAGRRLGAARGAARGGLLDARPRRAAPRRRAAGVMRELNALGDSLREQRLGAVEAGALLRAVMAEIDVAVFAFDDARPAAPGQSRGRALLAADERPRARRRRARAGRVPGGRARELGTAFPGGTGPWELRRTQFRQPACRISCSCSTDLSQPLREEERLAWQRLVRVLGHEINNSLAPIQSDRRQPAPRSCNDRLPIVPQTRQDDLDGGLDVIARAPSRLARFMGAYARLARLPPPSSAPLEIGTLVSARCRAGNPASIACVPAPALEIELDRDQIEQVLINLIAQRRRRRAGNRRRRRTWSAWNRRGRRARRSRMVDDDPASPAPPICLSRSSRPSRRAAASVSVLWRQIAEAHGGALALANRDDGRRGCIARVRLTDARAPGLSPATATPSLSADAD